MGVAVDPASNDVIYIEERAIVESTGFTTVIADGSAIDEQYAIAGTVAGQGTAIFFDDRALLTITDTGNILSGSDAVVSRGTDAQIINNGTITGDTSGVSFAAGSGDSTFINTGSILSGGDAINLLAPRVSITNTGTITGNDRLDGGTGNDVLVGGANVDLFVFGTDYGVDRATDFTNNLDFVDLVGGLVFADLTIFSIAGGVRVAITGNASDRMDLMGVVLADITSADFL